MKTIKILAILAIGIAVGSTLASASVNLAVCEGCHGQHFEKKALGVSKIVKDLNATEISKALIGYKNGTFGGPMKGIMKGQVSKYSDTDLRKASKTIKKHF